MSRQTLTGIHPADTNFQNSCIDATANVVNEVVVIEPCNGSAGQAWYYNGKTLSVYGDKCLTVTGGTNANSNPLSISTCTPGNKNQLFTYTNQQWIQWTGSQDCVDLTNGVDTPGNKMQMFNCSGGIHQVWNLVSAPPPTSSTPPPPISPQQSTKTPTSTSPSSTTSLSFTGTPSLSFTASGPPSLTNTNTQSTSTTTSDPLGAAGIIPPPPATTIIHGTSSTAPAIGGVVGALAFIAFLVAIAYIIIRRRKNRWRQRQQRRVMEGGPIHLNPLTSPSNVSILPPTHADHYGWAVFNSDGMRSDAVESSTPTDTSSGDGSAFDASVRGIRRQNTLPPSPFSDASSWNHLAGSSRSHQLISPYPMTPVAGPSQLSYPTDRKVRPPPGPVSDERRDPPPPLPPLTISTSWGASDSSPLTSVTSGPPTAGPSNPSYPSDRKGRHRLEPEPQIRRTPNPPPLLTIPASWGGGSGPLTAVTTVTSGPATAVTASTTATWEEDAGVSLGDGHDEDAPQNFPPPYKPEWSERF